MCRPMHLVLNHCKELLRGFDARIVVHARGVDVEDLSPEDALRRTDVADAGEQFVEVVAAAGLLEAFVVHGEAFDQVLLQLGGGALAELRAARRADTVADGEDHLQAVEFDFSRHGPAADRVRPSQRCS